MISVVVFNLLHLLRRMSGRPGTGSGVGQCNVSPDSRLPRNTASAAPWQYWACDNDTIARAQELIRGYLASSTRVDAPSPKVSSTVRCGRSHWTDHSCFFPPCLALRGGELVREMYRHRSHSLLEPCPCPKVQREGMMASQGRSFVNHCKVDEYGPARPCHARHV